jgi:hypothetical protein
MTCPAARPVLTKANRFDRKKSAQCYGLAIGRQSDIEHVAMTELDCQSFRIREMLFTLNCFFHFVPVFTARRLS